MCTRTSARRTTGPSRTNLFLPAHAGQAGRFSPLVLRNCRRVVLCAFLQVCAWISHVVLPCCAACSAMPLPRGNTAASDSSPSSHTCRTAYLHRNNLLGSTGAEETLQAVVKSSMKKSVAVSHGVPQDTPDSIRGPNMRHLPRCVETARDVRFLIVTDWGGHRSLLGAGRGVCEECGGTGVCEHRTSLDPKSQFRGPTYVLYRINVYAACFVIKSLISTLRAREGSYDSDVRRNLRGRGIAGRCTQPALRLPG